MMEISALKDTVTVTAGRQEQNLSPAESLVSGPLGLLIDPTVESRASKVIG
jgi:hypothetical protein